ncbi:MAG: hypothetical protein KJZ80_10520 [Hyphomicrobiaceae bacterium]|nr:hypothetical protein [Hyphomicrobiaceae bacterium]
MEIPAQMKPLCWGAVGGAAALALIGFNWGGWVTAGTADAMAKQRADAAVVTALAPICVENFRRETDAAAQQAALKKASSWQQGTLVEKAGWATMPGKDTPNTGVARACAEMISKLEL